jgi:virginiamycin A acetyltransferase
MSKTSDLSAPGQKSAMTFLRRLWRRLAGTPPESPFLSQQPAMADFRIGEGSYGWPNVLAFGDKGLTIGRFCSIAKGVTILLKADHRIDWVTTYPFSELWPEASGHPGHPTTKGEIVIGHDVWIGQDAIIMSGVRIGNGAVVAAGSIVTSDVPAYGIVGGNPARLIRSRFSPEQVSALERIAWWDWPREKIVAALPQLLAPDIDEFIRMCDPAPVRPN